MLRQACSLSRSVARNGASTIRKRNRSCWAAASSSLSLNYSNNADPSHKYPSSTICHRCQSTISGPIDPSTKQPPRPGFRGGPRLASSVAATDEDELGLATNDYPLDDACRAEIRRLVHMRNVGVFAHVDAGKTTVTERMLALAGVIRQAGCVDDGNTVTDFLPAERERGITIQSAAISFEWGWHNNPKGDDYDVNDNVTVSLIDTPGHIDFSVEVCRSVAVLDGAVLVVDAVAGAQAQTETVWRAMTRPSLENTTLAKNEHTTATSRHRQQQEHTHEPLSCIAVVNKMDKEGSNFGGAIRSIRQKLAGANPVAIQLPIVRASASTSPTDGTGSPVVFANDTNLVAVPVDAEHTPTGAFAGVVDLLHMRAILWSDTASTADLEDCVPVVVPLLHSETHEPIDPNCQVTREALRARFEVFESLAEVDKEIEEYYLSEQEPSNAELRMSLRKAVLGHKILPVLASAALRGKGIEPILDAVADLLPSPLDRLPPAVNLIQDGSTSIPSVPARAQQNVALGHPLHPSVLALAFKVVHMKGRGGSGDGRVVFARVYSGQLRDGDKVKVISPPAPGELPDKPRSGRVGGMLELAGGEFGKLREGICRSGEVCAIVGLKSVTTGDTIIVQDDGERGKKNRKKTPETYYLAGVSSPKPVLTVRLEAETTEQQTRLSEALSLLAVEDPSLVVEETDSSTLLSGLGELHIEVTVDRLRREHGVNVMVGDPAVTYRETITGSMESQGLVNFDRTVGATRMQGAVHLILEPTWCTEDDEISCMMLADPVVTVGPRAREFLGVESTIPEEELILRSEAIKALIGGCQGALQRGPLGPFPLANVKCHIVDVDAEDGPAALQAFPGALRAAAANAVSVLLRENMDMCSIVEPSMSVEVTVPNDMVGDVLSDLTTRRGKIDEVLVGDKVGETQTKALVRGQVPLAEILGYANGLRSLTGGEGAFTAEYEGHSPMAGTL